MLILGLTGILYSCEKAISFNLNDVEQKLVVEAFIENNQPPIVVLTTSQSYFSLINPDSISSSFIKNAQVFVSNGTLTHQLKGYSSAINNKVTLHWYSIDSTSLQTAFTGSLNKTYTLRILWNGKEYNSTTRIPMITKRIDSIYWKKAPALNDSNQVAVLVKAFDPPGYGDYIRYFTKRNSEPFYAGLNSVFDDQIIDGISYEIELERGVNRNESRPDGFTFFEKGDTVTMKLCNIDKQTYDFWRTMEFSYASIGNPFSTPTKVVSNISNGALGYFGGYACQFRTLIIPK
jgi:hypothetical protein